MFNFKFRKFYVKILTASKMYNLGNFAFHTTLAYNLFRNYVQPKKWTWYSRINDHLILGAMPFQSMVEVLKAEERIGGVVCCTEEFELEAAWGAMKPADWAKHGVEFHHTPMIDFFGSTSLQNIQQAVKFIERIASEGKTCYVHCKAGRTRSATVAICYMMYKYDQAPEEAFAQISQSRPQVMLRTAHRQTVQEFRQFLDREKQQMNGTNGAVENGQAP